MMGAYGIVQPLQYVLKNLGELRLILTASATDVMGHQTKIDLGQLTLYRTR